MVNTAIEYYGYMCLCIFAYAHMHTHVHTCIKNLEIVLLTPNGPMHWGPVCGHAMGFFWDVDKWGSDTPFLRTICLVTILNLWERIHTWLADLIHTTPHEFWVFFWLHSKSASPVHPAIYPRLDCLHEADWSAPCCPALRNTDWVPLSGPLKGTQ